MTSNLSFVDKIFIKVNIFYLCFWLQPVEYEVRNNKTTCYGVVSNKVIQNNHHSFYNEGVQAIKIRKNGDYNG